MQIVFWLCAAFMCLGAVGFLLWPILRAGRSNLENLDRVDHNVALYRSRVGELDDNLKDGLISESEYEQLEKELQLALLADTGEEINEPGSDSPAGSLSSSRSSGKLSVVAAVLVVVFAVVAYSDFGLSFGSLNDLVLSNEMLETTPHDIVGMRATVTKLARRMENQPDNDQGWFLLAQSWRSLSEYRKAADAFGRLTGKYPSDAALAGYYAESLFLAEDQQFSAPVQTAVDHALSLDAKNLQMLEMSAMNAYRQGDVNTAFAFFRSALASGVTGERADLLQQAISRLAAESGVPVMTELEPAALVTPESAPAGRLLTVLVEVAAGVDAKPDDTVYVYARAFGGPPMPLAVQRLTVAGLPMLVTLTPEMAMMPGMSLNDVDQVQLVARISASGIANASPDDYEVSSEAIDMRLEHPVFKLTIRERRG